MDAYIAGAYTRAEEEFRAAVRIDPGMADAWLGLHALRSETSAALLAMHRHRDRFGEQRRLHRRPLSSWYWLGWWVQPVLEDARDLALAHASHWLDGRHLTELEQALADCPPRERDRSVRFLHACRSYLLKDWEQLIRDTDGLLDDPLLGIEAGLFGGMARVRLDMCGQAELPLSGSLARCRSEQPQRKELRYWLARAYEGGGRSAAALSLYRAVHRVDPGFMDTTARLAAITAEDGVDPALLEAPAPPTPQRPRHASGGGSGQPGPSGGDQAFEAAFFDAYAEGPEVVAGLDGSGADPLDGPYSAGLLDGDEGVDGGFGESDLGGGELGGGELGGDGFGGSGFGSGDPGDGAGQPPTDPLGPQGPERRGDDQDGREDRDAEAGARHRAAQSTTPLPPGTMAQPDRPRLEAALAELDRMVGMEPVKRQVLALSAQLRMAQLRSDQGLPVQPPKRHFVFSGPSGTGKTTVARILGRVFYALGLLSGDHLVEAQRADLVGEFLGQTAVKANELIDSALDGVLFIDEAYSLANSGYSKGDAYGDEALQVLLKRAEDNRDRLVVILAGYPEGMNRLLAANPGLNSRFTSRVDFPSYRPVELAAIGQALAESDGDFWDEEALEELRSICAHVVREGWIDELGNGRFMRTLYEKSCAYRDLRLSVLADPPTRQDLATLRLPDVLQAYGELIEGRS
ncbi:AAA family ATPase [Streptacidiphilus carbonis]|uniref:AAA family ATPase n=1 Tax=Streptacidiphilus carbonis TaxID=105422 RepID=UPI000AB7D47A|nr:AAA family ATPase [Streptacidiphilus carbonis]